MNEAKEKLKNVDWWEVGYFLVYGLIYVHEFLYTTMFDIQWPPRTGYVLMALSTLYTVAKLIWYKGYTKREKIFALLLCAAFAGPALLTDYTYIYWTGFLIVGAKDIDFSKILRFYLAISITIMLAAFSASQCGIIEDLQYLNPRGDELFVRHSFGIVYPTDYAAHLFYMVMAAMVLYDKKWNIAIKVWLSLLVALSVYLTSNAQSSTICLIGFAGLCVFERIFRSYMPYIEKVFRWVPIICAVGFLGMAYMYDARKTWMAKLNKFLSFRLELSKKGFEDYSIKFFGQNVAENGLGTSTVGRDNYFYLDDSYIRILLEYGLVVFVVTLAVLVLSSRKAAMENKFVLVIALVAIAVQSVMEQHLIDIAYNPMILALFATLSKRENIGRNIKTQETKDL